MYSAMTSRFTNILLVITFCTAYHTCHTHRQEPLCQNNKSLSVGSCVGLPELCSCSYPRLNNHWPHHRSSGTGPVPALSRMFARSLRESNTRLPSERQLMCSASTQGHGKFDSPYIRSVWRWQRCNNRSRDFQGLQRGWTKTQMSPYSGALGI